MNDILDISNKIKICSSCWNDTEIDDRDGYVLMDEWDVDDCEMKDDVDDHQ